MNKKLPDGISNMDYLAVNSTVMTMGFRALLAAHPQPQEVRRVYDQLLGQTLATPAAHHPGYSQLMRDMTEVLFRPAVAL